jgi:hypothetical protein
LPDRVELLTLAAEVRQELDAALRLAREAAETWAKGAAVPEEERRTYVESTALKLHNFYTACERIFERVAGVFGGVPHSPDWHLRLLRTMSLDIPEVRPPIISTQLVEMLVDYLRFRHLVRNVYGFELEEGRMQGLVTGLPDVAREVSVQVGAFRDQLERLGGDLGD